MSDPTPPNDDSRRVLAQTIPGDSFDPEAAREYLLRTSTTGYAARAAAPGDETPLIRGERLGQRLASVGVAWSGGDEGPRFVVGDLLGAGATGRVFTVRDRDLDRDLAIKFLSGAATRDAAQIRAFLDEARITASLAHPNVLPVHEVDVTANGEPFFSMTKIAGATLESAIEQSSPQGRDRRIASWNAVASIVIAVGNALAYAHHRGLVHQDVKPGNILLGDFGEVLLLDWGSAAHFPSEGPGKLYGTPLYMSPEQARRENSTPRSDVYCLGATLFHALTLRMPTWDDDPEKFWEKKRTGLIDPVTPQERMVLPAELLSIALKAMSPAAGDRYQTVEDFVRDVVAWQSGQAVSAHRDSLWRLLKRWYSFNRRVVWVALVALAALGVLGGELWREKQMETTRWRLIYSSDFSAPDAAAAIGRDWVLKSKGWNGDWAVESLPDAKHFRLEDGRLVSHIDEGFADIAFAHPRAGDLRVEFDYTPLHTDQNLNCFICADDRNDGYTCHIGGWGESSLMVLSRGARFDRVVNERRRGLLKRGKTLHFSLERDAGHIRLTIDGDRIFDYVDNDPISAPGGAGFGFDACLGNDNAVANIRVYHRSFAEHTSPLAIGDRLFQLGHFAEAAKAFAEVQETFVGRPLEPAAEYRRARSLIAADDATGRQLLEDFCTRFPREADVPVALVSLRRLARIAGDHERVAAIDRSLLAYRGHPALINVLHDLGEVYAKRYAEMPRPRFYGELLPTPEMVQPIVADVREVKAWCEAHGVPFSFTELHSGAESILNRLGRGDLVCELSPDEAWLDAMMLLDQGRPDEAERRYGSEPHVMFLVNIRRGRPDLAFPLTESMWERQGAAVDMDRPELIAETDPGDRSTQVVALINAGHFDEALSRYSDLRGWCSSALVQVGRFDEVLEHYGDTAEQYPGERFHALIGVGRCDEALTMFKQSGLGLSSLTAVHEVAIGWLLHGERARADALLAEVAPLPATYNGGDPAAMRYLLPALLRVYDGEHVDLAQAWKKDVFDHRYTFGQRLWHVAAFVSGQIDEAAFLAQPIKQHLPPALRFARGMRAEVEGRRADALASYREAAVARPAVALDWPTRLFIRWRIQELSKP